MTIVFLIICWMLSVDDHLCVMIAVLKQVKQSACLCLCLCLFIFIRSHYLNPEVLCTRSESVSSARPHRDNKIPVATVPLSLSNPALWLAVGVRDWDRERREKERGIMFPLLAKGLSDWGSPGRVGLIFLPIPLIYFLIPIILLYHSSQLLPSALLNCNATSQMCR